MKESKFIELLNLYVDQQIDPAEAALLEDEILRNPARRRVYQQYCRMQRACAKLVEQARPDVSVGEKLAENVAIAHEKVMDFPEPRSARGQWVYLGGLAAACVALAFVAGRMAFRTPSPSAPSISSDQIVHFTPAVAPASEVAAGKINYQPVLLTHTLRMANNNSSPVPSSVTATKLSLDWMNQIKFTPVTVTNEELALGAQSGSKSNERDAQQRVFQNGISPKGPFEQEIGAFSFQR